MDTEGLAYVMLCFVLRLNEDRRLFRAFVRKPTSLAYRVLGFGETYDEKGIE